MSSGGQPELNREYPVPDEEALTARLVSLIKEMLEKSYLTGTTYRDTHAKGHAAVQGEFVIDPDLPPELRVGLFAHARSYPCWIRFANLSAAPKADIKGDVRAMALKLMGVEGPRLWQSEEGAQTLDIIMQDARKFLAPNLAQFYDLEVALDKGGLALARFFLTHPHIAAIILTSFKKCANLLEVPYYSQTAYLFGTRAVQYHIRPRRPATSKAPRDAPKNYLRQRLAEDLAHSDAYFDFMIQFQTDAEKMPIENPTVVWDEALSPYLKLAAIRIPSQTCDTPARRLFCENLSFNPWRTLPEHRPLGAINRARREAYPTISALRHYRNAAPLKEPTPDEVF
jgi:catalase